MKWAAVVLAAVAFAQPKRILYVTHSAGFVHGSIGASREAMSQVARRTGKLEIFPTEDLSYITADRLREFDAIFFFTSGELPLSDSQKRDLLDFVRSGKGFGGAHSATDTLYLWPEYGELIGAYFDDHPWTQEAGVDVEDPGHPATRKLGNSFRLLEEFYQFRSFSRDRVRVLLTLDTRTVTFNERVNRTDGDFALAWCRPYGNGRVFYTAFGHFDETWADSRFQDLLEGALLWLTGEVSADAAPRKSTPAIARVSNLAYDTDGVIAPGLLVSITGVGLTTGSSMSATSIPLPLRLAGTEVRLNGDSIPLLGAAPDRVVAHIPTTFICSGPPPCVIQNPVASLEVLSGAIQFGTPARLRVEPAFPGILGVIPIAGFLSIYATGLAPVPLPVPEVFVNGRSAEVSPLGFGFGSGLLGVQQVIAAIPAGLSPPLEIKLRSAGRDSNVVQVSF